MPLTRGLLVIAVLAGLGCLQVTQRNTLLITGYRVGSLAARLHAQETQLALRQAEVTGMASPQALARAAQERNLELVAWETVRDRPTIRMASATPDGE